MFETTVFFSETITELVLERAGPAPVKIFSWNIMNSFQTDASNLSCQEEQSLTIIGDDHSFQTGPIPQ